MPRVPGTSGRENGQASSSAREWVKQIEPRRTAVLHHCPPGRRTAVSGTSVQERLLALAPK
jgi:hypothetical protein